MSAYSEAVEADNPFRYWRLKENSGTENKGGTSVTLTGTSSVAAPGGPLSSGDEGATSWDGTNDTGQVAVNLSALSTISLEFWLWWDAFSNNDDLAFEYTANYNTNSGFIVDPNSASAGGGTFEFGFAVGTGAPETGGGHWTHRFTRPSAAAWHHYVLIMNRATPSNKAYVDGTEVSLTATDTHAATYGNFSNSILNVMCRNAAALFGAGDMAHLAIYEGALAKERVEAHYAATSGSPAPPRRLTLLGAGT